VALAQQKLLQQRQWLLKRHLSVVTKLVRK